MSRRGRLLVLEFVGQALFGVGLLVALLSGLCAGVTTAIQVVERPVDPSFGIAIFAGLVSAAVGFWLWRRSAKLLRELGDD